MRRVITLDPELHKKHRMLAGAKGGTIADETDAAILRNLEENRELLKSGARMPKKGKQQ